ncbi:LytTR family DNA-binding domain-containing protein [Mitsuaria sp. GD03876]|uniref:LytR/AlgR family response regulator transcription factor n=1 Tax=Mitsuaria sp. GD03876 TaxID=2975399 RepID=UPI00244BBBD1|nr:LytTR family DNA-binding domain-containing protein [Mitsuaria sp. GD03876]MDH0866214.1 LytTR family DNA-binding domain-containing protein [Mitsuaria sp. GD03876]
MPTALIAEDEELLAAHLRQELRALWPELDVVAMATHGEEAVDLALRHRPAVCFLDIRMPGMTGLEAATQLADDWPDDTPFPLLVFVTAYDQFALQAFERAAVDYVLKPVQRERLGQTVTRLQAALAQRQAPPAALASAIEQLRGLLGGAAGATPAVASAVAGPAATAPLRHLQVGVGDAIVMLPVDEVVYLEAADKYVRVLTADQEYLVRISLRELLPQLDPQRFWQVHRGHIVHVDAIDRVHRDDTGKLTLRLRRRPERLAVSRMYASLFKAL